MRGGSPLAIVLVVWVASLFAAGRVEAGGPNGSTRVWGRAAGTGTSLLDALKDDRVSHIVIVPDRLDLAAELAGVPGKVHIGRNVTVSGARGTDTVLDQAFLRGRIELCGACTWTYSAISVANDHKGSDAANDLFVAAQLGAKVVLRGAVVLRRGCPSPSDLLGVLNLTPRSAAFGPGAPTQQQHEIRNITVQGVSHPDSLFALDFSTDVAPSQEGRTNSGGYALRWLATGRACGALVDPSCLDSKSTEACTIELTEALLSGQAGGKGQRTGAAAPLPPASLAAAIAVPVVVVAAAGGGLALWLCRRGTGRGGGGGGGGSRSGRRKRGGGDDAAVFDGDEEAGGGGPDGDNGGSGGPIRPDEPLRRPLGLQQGWSVSKSCTTPFVDAVEDDNVEFGELIGSGSFGRVYQARWAGRDVAVKVIEHNTDTSPSVEREVTLMLSFNHPNIVRAFHFVTRVHHPEGGHTPLHGSVRETASGHDVSVSNADLLTNSSAGSRVGVIPEDRTPSDTAPTTGHEHATANAAFVAAAAAVRKGRQGAPRTQSQQGGGGGGGAGGAGQDSSTSASGQTSGGSRCSARSGGSSSDKPGGAASSSVSNNPQLQLVQRLPSLTGGTPRLVHKVETWLVQEYCDCGTLAAVAAEWKHEPESDQKMLERLLLLQDCARGLKELHSRNVVHGDLNARNVLLSSSAVSSVGVVAKLADLGLSRIIRSTRSHHSTNTIGTMSHVAPELLRYGHMSQAGDLYSFGIMMWELYTGLAAFHKLHVGQFFEAIVVRNLRPIIPRGMAADYQLLMQACWSAEPNDRPSVDRLLNCLKHMVAERESRLSLPRPPTSPGSAAMGPGGLPVAPGAAGGVCPPLTPTEAAIQVHNQQHLQAQILALLRGSGSFTGSAGRGGSFTVGSAAAGGSLGGSFTVGGGGANAGGSFTVGGGSANAGGSFTVGGGSANAGGSFTVGGGGPGSSFTIGGGSNHGGAGSFSVGNCAGTAVARSAHSYPPQSAAAAASLPGLLLLLRERGHAVAAHQQRMMQELAGGRLYNSAPDGHHARAAGAAAATSTPLASGGAAGAGSSAGSRDAAGEGGGAGASAGAGSSAAGAGGRLLSAGRRGGRDQQQQRALTGDISDVMMVGGHSQSDPLPAYWGLQRAGYAHLQGPHSHHHQQAHHHQQLLRPQAMRGGGGAAAAFQGFASSLGGGRPGELPTPVLPGLVPRGTSAMVTPLTGVTYQYGSAPLPTSMPMPGTTTGAGTAASTGSGSTAGATAGGSGGAASGPLPHLQLPVSELGSGSVVRGGSAGTSSGGSGPLLRQGSLGNSNWYWQRGGGGLGLGFESINDNDTASVTDQEAPARVDDPQPGCPDVMAKVQLDNNWYV